MPKDPPIYEVLETVKVLSKDMKTIRDDISIIKAKINEMERIRKEQEKFEEELKTKGWFW